MFAFPIKFIYNSLPFVSVEENVREHFFQDTVLFTDLKNLIRAHELNDR